MVRDFTNFHDDPFLTFVHLSFDTGVVLGPWWRKASSRGEGEAIGRYSEKEKKTFLKKGSNNLLNEFHEGRN